MHYEIIMLLKFNFCFLISFLFLVCNAGYFIDGDSCSICPGNTIKMSPGNATACDTTCDGVTTVPNGKHTTCGEFLSYSQIYDI